MARNREPLKPVDYVKYQSESGEEEDEEGASEESESDSEPEQTQTQTQTAMQKKPQPQQQPPSSSEEEESGSETESDSDGPDSNVRPLAFKATEKTQKSIDGAGKGRSKPNAAEPVTPTKPVVAKRPSEDTAASDAKKPKASEPETSEKKPNHFQRLWSEEDEIVILKGMIEYSAKNKCDPLSDMNGFHEFIKESLHMDFTRSQLQDKIRRLKKKYENNKSKENGKEMSFAKLHEQSAYDLSKQIWGNEAGKENGAEKVANGSVARKTAEKKANVVEGVKNAVVALPTKRAVNSNSGVEEKALINGGEKSEVGQDAEGENEWEKLKREELQLYLKQLELRIAQTKLVLNAMKGGDE